MTDANQEYYSEGFGARLQAAREAMHLTRKEAGLRLHLSPAILEILETENFQNAPPVTFIRGYLRSYARLLNFSEEEIGDALMQSGLESQATTLIASPLQTETMQMTDRHVQRISTVVIVGLFIFTGIWWGFHSSSTSNNSNNRLTRPVSTVQQTPQATQPAAPNPPVVATTVAPATTTSTTAQPAPPIAPTPATPPPVAASALPPSATPGMPAVTPFTATPIQPDTTVASTEDTPTKHKRRHRQDSTVSGMTMALPEPGL